MRENAPKCFISTYESKKKSGRAQRIPRPLPTGRGSSAPVFTSLAVFGHSTGPTFQNVDTPVRKLGLNCSLVMLFFSVETDDRSIAATLQSAPVNGKQHGATLWWWSISYWPN